MDAQLYVVTKDGQKVSAPMSLTEANTAADQLKSVMESQGATAIIKVVPVLMG